MFFNLGSSSLWDYIWALVVGLAIVGYSIALIISRSQYAICSSTDSPEAMRPPSQANESIFG